jgi:hypothetical protein
MTLPISKKITVYFTVSILIALLSLYLVGCGGGGSESSTNGNGSSFRLTWDAPTKRTDGSPLPESNISGYKVYFGSFSGQYDEAAFVNDSTSFTIGNPSPGDIFYAVTVFDTFGNESDLSDEVSLHIE